MAWYAHKVLFLFLCLFVYGGKIIFMWKQCIVTTLQIVFMDAESFRILGYAKNDAKIEGVLP